MSGYKTINPPQPTETCRDPRCGNPMPHIVGLRCEYESAERYYEGDTVTVHHLIYPGPRSFTAEGRIIKCLSPTYYEIEYVDHRGTLCTKRFRRSQLP